MRPGPGRCCPVRSTASAAHSTKASATQSSGWPQKTTALTTPRPASSDSPSRWAPENRHSRATASSAKSTVEARTVTNGTRTSQNTA